MNDELQQRPGHTSPFEAIRRVDEEGHEYWSARELYKLLGYSRWEKFQYALEQAQKACENSGQAVSDHFHLEVQLIKAGKGARRPVENYHLSRYACYLVVQNADPSKPIVALASREHPGARAQGAPAIETRSIASLLCGYTCPSGRIPLYLLDSRCPGF